MTAKLVRRRRMPGSRSKLLWSHTPDRTDGSAGSSSTAVIPPANSETGLANTCQAMPSGGRISFCTVPSITRAPALQDTVRRVRRALNVAACCTSRLNADCR